MKFKEAFLGLIVALGLNAGPASAATITSYTMTGVPDSGYAGWSYNYAGGSGTLNDGILPTSYVNNLFLPLSFNPSITFTLDGFYHLSSIDILSAYLLNAIPGNLYSATVTINGISATVFETGFGDYSGSGYRINERLVLPGALSALSANSFTLSDFVARGVFNEYTALGEVQVNGIAAAVPEPSTWAMLILGFAGIGFMACRRKPKPSWIAA